MKGHLAAGLETPGGWLTDVVQYGRPPQYQVGAFGLQRDGLIEDLQGMRVDDLVLTMLVRSHAQRRQPGQDDVGETGVDEYLQAAAGGLAEQQLRELTLHPLVGD